MTDLNTMTVAQLRAVAADRDVETTKKMTKAQLVEAINDAIADTADEDFGNEPAVSLPTPDVVVERKRRKISAAGRDDSGKVVRKGVNLSGNTPYRRKFYYITSAILGADGRYTTDFEAAIAKAPNQVKAIVKAMVADKVFDGESAKQGKTIVDRAKELGFLNTRLKSDVLFAYYRRLLETLGVILASDAED